MTIKNFVQISGVAVLAASLFALPSSAQSSRLQPFPVTGEKSKNVNISISYQFFMAGETDSVGAQAALADEGRRHLYKLLAKECEVLLETIASECAMNRANVNTQLRRERGNRQEGVRVSGSATYQIQLKPNKEQ